MSTDDVIRNAIAQVSKNIRCIDWFEATEIRGHLADGRIAYFQVMVKFGFRLEN